MREVYGNKTCMCLYRNKNNTNYIYIIVSVKNLCMSIPKQNKNNYIYTIISPEKQRARISIGKTIRKKPQNKLARRVVRRKEKKNLLA